MKHISKAKDIKLTEFQKKMIDDHKKEKRQPMILFNNPDAKLNILWNMFSFFKRREDK